MKRLAIVSSHSQSCGNAAFTRVLHDTIEQYADVSVEVVELDLELLQSAQRSVRRAADEHIRKVCEQLKGFDAVNIQFEPSLFGVLPRDIHRRMARLIAANPDTSVTLHSPRIVGGSGGDFRSAVANILRFRLRAGVGGLVASLRSSLVTRLNRKVIQSMVRHGRRAIVHTERARRQIRAIFGYANVDVHPLKIVKEGFVADPSVLGNIRDELQLAETDILIGMFGYISAYKGHLDALEAMRYLPPQFKLMIFGRQHPQNIKTDGKIDVYLEKLVKKVTGDSELTDRVFFLGELDDDRFLHVAAAIDVAWLPYYENGQDGSGIASICMDLCPRVLASASFAFDELARLVTYSNVVRFDIGNYVELADKTAMIMRRPKPEAPYCDPTRYTVREQAMLYVRSLVASL